MANPLTTEILLQPRSLQRRVLKDQETGCRAHDEATLELCKQSFYLKQQNELMRQQTSNQFQLQQENTQLKTELETIRREIETLKLQQTVVQPETQPMAKADNNLLATSIYGVNLPTISLVFIVGISAAFLIGRKFFKRQ